MIERIADFWEPVCCQIDKKNTLKEHQKNDHQKTWNLIPKGFQNGAKIDAKTHQKSMPKLVTKKIMEIIKNHVSLNCKIIEIQIKNKRF